MKTKLRNALLVVALGVSNFIFAQVSITGTGTGGWVQPGNLALTSTDGIVWTASNFEIVGDGNMKFSEGGSWETTGGFTASATTTGFPSGTITINAGANIIGTLGFWNVTYNMTTKEYLFTPGVNPNPVVTINGGGLAAPIQMQTNNGLAYFKKSVYFPGGDASFNQEGTANQWGGAFPDGPVVNGGTITVPTGIFNTYFVMPGAGPAEYVFEPTIVSMIGNFEGSAWGNDLDLETTDNIHYTKTNWVGAVFPGWNDTELHLKFRDNHDWTMQYGCTEGGNGSNNLALSGTSQNGINGGGGDIFIPFGTYNVDFNRTTGTWTFTNVLSNDTFSSSTVKVYPNPTTSVWTFENKNNENIVAIQIMDVTGKVVVNSQNQAAVITIDSSELNSGVYFAKVITTSATSTIKLVKN
ncbi:MAG: hypothetical protein RIT03_1006 [Bacteroidota bacterium]|jgi:hypothetical protein